MLKVGAGAVSLFLWLFVPFLSEAQLIKSPESRFIFHVRSSELDSLRSVIVRFAKSETLFMFDNGARLPPKPPDGRQTLFLILKTQDEDIQATVSNVREENEILVIVFGNKEARTPNPIASRLVNVLHEKWPDIQPYRGP